MIENRDLYNLIIEKSKQADLSVRMLLQYDLSNEQYMTKLNEDSKNMIKIEYIKGEKKPNQIVLLVDSKFTFILDLGRMNLGRIQYATYSNKESVLLCYVNLIEYQSLMSQI